ncbi:MAG: TRAP transporter small permease subunit [Gammaproteobacteria bacterium]
MMTTLLTRLDRLTDLSGRLLSTLTLILTVILFITVLMRYGLKLNDLQIGDWRLPRQAMEESVMYLHCILFMLASAYTLRSDAHVRVDVFYRRFTPRTRAIIRPAGQPAVPAADGGLHSLVQPRLCGLLVEAGGKIPEAEGLPWVYLLKTLIP